jgi:hypothetical protein
MGLAGALLSVAGGAASAFADGGTASVTGTVTDASTSAALADVSVQITSEDGSYFDSTQSADDGTYTLSTIPAGSYTLTFLPADGTNFVEQCWQNAICNYGTPTFFDIADGQVLTGFDAALVPGATITGTVDGSDAPGVGLAGVGVDVSSPLGGGGGAQTDAAGNYTIIGLPAGDYTVDFQPSAGNYLEQWWNDQPTGLTTNTLRVAAGATVPDIDAHLALGATISGTVSTADGPLADATVEAVGANSELGDATTNSDGNYTISALIPDSYTVAFMAPQGQNLATQYWQDANTLATATALSLTATNSATGIDATLTAGASISGRVFAPGTPKVGLKHASISIYDASGGGPVANAETNKSGRYHVDGLPAGAYTIGMFPEQGVAAAPEWWGGSFIQTGAKALTLAVGQAATHINQQLIVGSVISGTVTAGGAPEPNAEVEIWASDQIAGQSANPPYQTGTDSSGNFSFPNLGPGKYTLFFGSEDQNFTSQWWNDKSSQPKATKLVVTRNVDVSGVNATLNPAIITAGIPTITGKARIGDTLTAHTGNWQPKNLNFSYQWLRNGAPILDATDATYVPTAADLGKVLTVAVTGEIANFESQGLTQTVTSAGTQPVKCPAS